MSGYPKPITRTDHVEAVPRRIRAMHGDEVVLDTTDALYVWEWAAYPQYYIPRRDVDEELLASDGRTEPGPQGTRRLYSFADAGPQGPAVGGLIVDSPRIRLVDTFRFDWERFDAWFEEDEEVFVHPRNPYTRVDALRSTPRRAAWSSRGSYWPSRRRRSWSSRQGSRPATTSIGPSLRLAHLEPSPTVTSCPYKGTTSDYWSVVVGAGTYPDMAWSYNFPTRQLLPIAGLVAFYNEKVDLFVDGEREERPVTAFSDR